MVESLRAFCHVGFFVSPEQIACRAQKQLEARTMNDAEKTMVDEIAQLAIACQAARTGHTPTSAAVVLSDDTLVITLHEALSPAERALAKSAAGATQVQEFHRQLFLNSIAKLRTEIKRITGREVCEAAAEIEATTGTVVHAFTTGNVVQVFSLNGKVPRDAIAT